VFQVLVSGVSRRTGKRISIYIAAEVAVSVSGVSSPSGASTTAVASTVSSTPNAAGHLVCASASLSAFDSADHDVMRIHGYRFKSQRSKTHKMAYLHRSFSAKEPYN